MDNISIVGAAGRMGLPTSIICAGDFDVSGIDINEKAVNKLTQHQHLNSLPFKENGFTDNMCDNFRKVKFTTSFDSLIDAKVIVVIIGTPVDSEGNANLQPLIDFTKDKLCSALSVEKYAGEKLIILRSTVAPGTTDCIKKIIEENTGLIEGMNFHLAFCPERVSQGNALTEMAELPQIIGAYNHIGWLIAKQFFIDLGFRVIHNRIKPIEAELGKLMTNMYRYVNFAFANEMYMIGQSYGADIHKIINICNYEYPRMNMPLPGPNAAGPCLGKDGRFLVENLPFGELINNSFLINEGMPQFMFKESQKLGKIKTAMIMGMTFKKENDDIRLSLSYKLRKILKKNNIKIIEADGFLDGNLIYNPTDFEPEDIDAIFVMTPHDHLVDDFKYRLVDLLRKDCIIADGWKALNPNMNKTIYKVEEIT